MRSVIDEINKFQYAEITDIGENENGDFQFTIWEMVSVQSEASNDSQDKLNSFDDLVSKSYPILHTDSCKQFKVIFPAFEHFCYSVVDESYAHVNSWEEYEYSGCIGVYTKSAFLDYLDVETIACDVYPGPYKHYSICSLSKIINVASTSAPEIVRLK
ncbi:hypothetical protein RZY50_004697 [Vibrio parahaemolyticus]|nr:hypothetical protein [Vibrio parahaemolyticus]